MIEKPKTIYRKELPPVGLKHKFGTYIDDDEDAQLNKLQIIWYGLTKKDMIPKYHRKYDEMILNFKAAFVSVVICLTLLFVCVHSSVMEEKLSNISADYDVSDTYFNRGLNYLIDAWDSIYYNINNYFKN
jgi:hypothetical protein